MMNVRDAARLSIKAIVSILTLLQKIDGMTDPPLLRGVLTLFPATVLIYTSIQNSYNYINRSFSLQRFGSRPFTCWKHSLKRWWSCQECVTVPTS